ncbi:MAG: rhodanese-like domain-containing protein [Planctomycetaceae bacterium]
MTNRLLLWNLTAVCAMCFTVCSFAAEPTNDSLATVKKNVAAKKAVLVDVREKSEWDSGHIAGAVFVPLSELENGTTAAKLAKRLPKKQIIYTHCVAGIRSCTAADVLRKFGYEVRPLKPGYDDLIDAGFPESDE